MNITGQIVDQLLLSKISYQIGEIKQSVLEEAAFNAATLGTWYKLDGRSCIGTQYQALTGNTNVPDATTEGTFLRQAKAGRNLGTFEEQETGEHQHHVLSTSSGSGTNGTGVRITSGNYAAYATGGNYYGDYNIPGTSTPAGYGLSSNPITGTETRPKNLAVNFYIKVND